MEDVTSDRQESVTQEVRQRDVGVRLVFVLLIVVAAKEHTKGHRIR